ncbi:MAG: glycosyltransferase family 4 protein [Bdellovibrionales bacterium]|nr:glycosyltransferase family 4 protein [Bdellovibrionales bacterium]
MVQGSLPNILILSAQVPFTRGGAEVLIERLRAELSDRGYGVDVVSLPFNAQPKRAILKQMALWRALDLTSFAGRSVDLVIATKFPTYMVKHPNKVTWLVHQHRQVYELYGTRFGDFDTGPVDESLRRMVVEADSVALKECRARYTISENVSRRLERYLGLESQSVLPPLPLGNAYRSSTVGDYILSVGRICSIKRVDLIVKSMPRIDERLKLKVVGLPDEPAIEAYLKSEIEKHHLWHRVEFLGRVSDDELIELYAGAFAVYYAPYDEDYGFVTLEALASGRPVITATDSGTVLEFIRHEENGLVLEPNEQAIAEGVNRLLHDQPLQDRVRNTLRNQPTIASPSAMTWDHVVARLTGECPPEQSSVMNG